MTVTADTATRYNPHRDAPCTPWCDGVHDDSAHSIKACMTRTGGISLATPGLASMWAVAMLGARQGSPVVAVGGHDCDKPGSLHLQVPPRDAGDLARLIEMLADATPDQHREIAAAIRQAAAQITEAGQ